MSENVRGADVVRDEFCRLSPGRFQRLFGCLTIAVCLLSFGMLQAIAAEPEQGGVAVVVWQDGAVSDGPDPLTSESEFSEGYLWLVYEPLFLRDADLNPVPYLAESWEINEDATVWTINIRKDVRFHDGTPLTAADAAATIRRILDPNLKGSTRAALAAVLDADGVQVKDEHTLVLNLKSPSRLVYMALSNFAAGITPEGFDPSSPDGVIGTGPFKHVSFKATESYEVERNDDYWQEGLPYLDGVRGVTIADTFARVNAVLSGPANLATEIVADQVPLVESSDAAELENAGIIGTMFMEANANLAPFDNPDVIAAIKLALDRERILDLVFQGRGSLAYDALVPQSSPFFPEELAGWTRDVAAAKEHLAKAGYPDGLDIELWSMGGNDLYADFSAVVAESLADAGIRVSIQQHPAETYWDQVWMVKPFFITTFSYQHPSVMLGWSTNDGPYNGAECYVPDFDELYQKASIADDQERIEIYRKIHKDTAEVCARFVPLYQYGYRAVKDIAGYDIDSARDTKLFTEAYLHE